MGDADGWRNSHNQQLPTSLRESIIDKPPCISGTLPLPVSCFSLLNKSAKDGLAARLAEDTLNLSSVKERLFRLTICHRYINLANATPDQLEKLTQACKPVSFGPKQEHVLDDTYRKARKMDPGCFASQLNPLHSSRRPDKDRPWLPP